MHAGKRVLLGWAGAWPGGLAPIDPNILPVSDEQVDVYVALAFAQDRDTPGEYVFHPGMSITSEQVAAASADGARKFLISLAGAEHPWPEAAAVSDLDGYIERSVYSLAQLMQLYHAVGIDINYELFPAGSSSFPAAMDGIVRGLGTKFPNLIVTLAPYGGVDDKYQQLYALSGPLISWTNYQLYADTPGPSPAEQGILARVQGLYGGIGKIALGITSDQRDFRGTISKANAVAIVRNNPDAIGAAVWSYEDATVPGYDLLSELLQALHELPVLPLAAAGDTVHTVQPGESLSAIAARFNTTVAELLQLNPSITDPDVIFAGDRLVVP
eukprot:GHRR01025748.1.p1 GENE.GHRR01025748.1~~GHRR01025748.1.p1  ORF type:complete len:328 (+),score=106.73 GHRR01025748.1:465-1448(+)